MKHTRHPLPALLAVAWLLSVAANVNAAESYDNCTGFIDALPATISTQGVWCLRQNLSTAITTGAAINIATNNVTIDCNDFKIGGLAAGDSSLAIGIYADAQQNATVRHCGIRGFIRGIWLSSGAGHLVEDNRLDNNLYAGIVISGDNNRVQRNRVYDTGGSTGNTISYGIYAAGDVMDNTVAGVFANGATPARYGIHVSGSGSVARGNQVRGLDVASGVMGAAIGIHAANPGITLAGNRISAEVATTGNGINGVGGNTFCTVNTVVGFATAYNGCEHNFGNLPEAAP
jgi:parallel beta-helix repeat protein